MSIIRSMDLELKARITSLIRCKKKPVLTHLDSSDLSASTHTLPMMRMSSRNYPGLFKGITQKFIVDSLIALYTVYNGDLPTPQFANERVVTVNVAELFDGNFLDAVGSDKLRLIEYFPSTFGKIRRREGISDEDLYNSLSPVENCLKLNNMTGIKGGKSNAFLYKTYDSRLYLKTITKAEKIFFLNQMLPEYNERLLDGDSVLVRIYGVYTLQLLGQTSINIMIMQNVVPCAKVRYRFDLKGTTADRKVKRAKDQNLQKLVLKDLDFKELIGKLDLEEEDRFLLLNRLSRDIAFLERHRVIDYSILLAVADYYPNERRAYRKHNDPTVFYFLALIDIMQPYSTLKRMENIWKTKFKCQKESAISTVEPEMYAQRFYKTLTELTL
mmetsp:Transcript_10734/g.20928  ORF Transcript_10734/g.20928 Transcript_10734/m.20928 type:complete len:385 (-) Transcript_10734:2679-3833(-)